jgi:hypothetical protein
MPDDEASVNPPSTGSVTPVIQPAVSEARKTMAEAMSSGVPRRFSGCILAAAGSSCQSISESLVFTTPGATAFTLTEGASSRASWRVKWISPALEML